MNCVKNHCVSLCFISDDLNHDVNLVHKVLTDTIAYINERNSEKVRKISYFSDGCEGQYNNCKHFLKFVPLSASVIGTKHMSGDPSFAMKFDFRTVPCTLF